MTSVAGVSSRAARLERAAPWIAGALVALPVLVARYPPMADVPAHEAAVGLLRHWGDARYVPPHVYTLNLGQPNQVFYFLILLLSYAVPVGTATKLVVAASLLLLPVAAAHVARHLGVTRWAALLVAPIGMGWMFFWGLLANLMGLAAYLFALPALDSFVARPTYRRFAVVVGWMVLLHFVHDFAALVAAITLVVFTACSWRGWRENCARVTPALLIVLAALAARAFEERHARPGEGLISFPPFLYRLRTLPDSLFAGTGVVSAALLGLAAIPLILFAFERRAGDAEQDAPPRLERFRFEILAGLCLVLYFAAPATINWTASSWTGVSQMNQRFLPLAWILLVLTVAPRSDRPASGRLARLLASVLPVAPFLVTWPEFVASDRAYRDLDAIVAKMDPGSAHALLELGPTASDALFSPASSGGHIVAMIGGRTLFDYTRSPTAPVVQRPEAQWNEVLERLERHPYRLVPSHDLRLFRYLVLHTSDPGLGELARLALEPEGRAIAHEGDFTLVESTLPRVPIDSADPPFPLPHDASLDERALATAKRLGTAAPGASP